MNQNSSIIALDVGSKRIGVAIANSQARIARPLMTLNVSQGVLSEIIKLTEQNAVKAIVVGRPRNQAGNLTDQTMATDEFVTKLKVSTTIPIYMIDESVTSIQAEDELKKSKKPYTKEEIDSLAATYILEEYLMSNGNGS